MPAMSGGGVHPIAVEPEGVATIARSRVCGTSRPVAESTGDMPISAVPATSGRPTATRKLRESGRLGKAIRRATAADGHRSGRPLMRISSNYVNQITSDCVEVARSDVDLDATSDRLNVERIPHFSVVLINSSWHDGQVNILETGPHSANPRPWP